MEDYYQDHHAAYHKKTFHIDPASFLEPLSKHLKPGDKILDVGCGSGRDLLWFKAHGFSVMGFERSEGLAALARKYGDCEIIEGDFETYDFSKRKFDAILLSGSLVHIPHARLEAVFGSVVGGLGAAGKVLISLKEGSGSSIDGNGRVFYFWQDEDLRDIFSKHDFNVLEFQRGVSKVNEKDTWLSYVLNKGFEGSRVIQGFEGG
jgi:SAM-dependent methyltransferase